jgi:hypothetical protein
MWTILLISTGLMSTGPIADGDSRIGDVDGSGKGGR